MQLYMFGRGSWLGGALCLHMCMCMCYMHKVEHQDKKHHTHVYSLLLTVSDLLCTVWRIISDG